MTRAWLATLLAMGAFVAFVGTVAFTSDNDRVARVRVEALWIGPSLSADVNILLAQKGDHSRNQ
jgi:hypothetical protein